MACGDSKCVPLCANLLYSMMTRPARAVSRARSLMAAWAQVPARFCSVERKKDESQYVWLGRHG